MLHDVGHRQKQLNEIVDYLKKLIENDNFKACVVFMESKDGSHSVAHLHRDGAHHISLSLLGHIGIWKTKIEFTTHYVSREDNDDEPEPPPTG